MRKYTHTIDKKINVRDANGTLHNLVTVQQTKEYFVFKNPRPGSTYTEPSNPYVSYIVGQSPTGALTLNKRVMVPKQPGSSSSSSFGGGASSGGPGSSGSGGGGGGGASSGGPGGSFGGASSWNNTSYGGASSSSSTSFGGGGSGNSSSFSGSKYE